MKILAIRGVNIASLAGSFEIDFTKEPLLSTGIFAITGPTGSGKSTILDVLSLALYENTPRLTKAGDTRIVDIKTESLTVNNPANLMRRGASEATAEVDFIGIDGKRYRATWYAYRGRKNINNKIQPTSVELTMLDTNQKYPGKKKETLNEISRLVGLTFHQFTRTVVLAQGEFAQFLKANDTERASLLEKLTGTEIYSEISKRIYQHTEAIKTEFKDLELRMGEHRLLSPDELISYQEESESLKKQIKETEIQILRLNKLLDWFKNEAELLNSIQTNQHDMDLLVSEQQSQEADNKTLEEYNTLTPAFQLLKNKIDLETKKDNISNIVKQLEDEINIRNIEKQAQERKLDDIKKAEEDFLKLEPEYDELIENVQKYTNAINTANQILEAENNKYIKAIEAFDNCQGRIARLNADLIAAENAKVSAENWLAANISRKDVVTNSSLIHHRLNEAGDSYQLITSLNKKEADEDIQYQECLATIIDLNKKCREEESAIAELSRQLILQQKEMADINIESIKKQLKEDNEKHEQLLLLSRIQENVILLLKEKSDNIVELQKAAVALKTLDVETKNLGDKLSEWKGKYEQQSSILGQLQQMASENIANLRTTLQPETPCPVCGSCDHPYAHQVNTYFEELYAGAVKSMDSLTQEGQELNQNAENLRLQKRLLEEKKSGFTLNSDKIDVKISDLRREWDNSLYATHFSFDNSDGNKPELLKAIDELSVRIHQSSSKILYYDEVDKLMRSNDMLLNQKKQLFSELKHKKETAEMRKGILEESKKDIRAQISNLTQKVDADLSSIDDYFNSKEWRNNWRKDVSAFKNSIDSFVNRWNDTAKLVETNQSLVLQFKSNIEIENRNRIDFEKEKNLLTDKIKDLNTDLNNYKKLLSDLTNDRTLEEIQKEHRGKKEKLTNDRKENQEKLNMLTETFATLSGQKTTLLQQQSNYNDQLKGAVDELNNWLSKLNSHRERAIQETTLQYYMSIPKESIDQIETNKKRIEEKIVVVKTQLKLNTDNLHKHRMEKSEDISYEETISKLTETEDVKNQLLRHQQEVEGKLLQHKTSCESLAGLQMLIEEKKKEVTNWMILNKEIGSAEGTSFKRIAQSYTLDLLLLTANAQIQLIAPRYQLQRIPDSLSLQVIDRDMCDQVRSVHSLSGGETFLLSLALALGLSSLSSSQMNIESLFIDEGFGSLDEESLMMAMDALESLRLQGRKVGVITHVKEMTERISTRIKVSKMHNGASEICIE